jgi:hypothetical protein
MNETIRYPVTAGHYQRKPGELPFTARPQAMRCYACGRRPLCGFIDQVRAHFWCAWCFDGFKPRDHEEERRVREAQRSGGSGQWESAP